MLDSSELSAIEVKRLQTLAALDLIDTPRDPVLDGLVRSAATLTHCPIALVSIVDGDRSWFKARYGTELTEVHKNHSFCTRVIQGDALMEVPDATQDKRFAQLPLVVGSAGIRFYVGVPLFVNGVNIGTLSVVDRKPRTLNEEQKLALHDLGQAVEHWMRSLKDRNEIRRQAADREVLFENMSEGVLLVDHNGRLLDANPAMLTTLRMTREQLLVRRMQDVLTGLDQAPISTHRLRGLAGHEHLQAWEAANADGDRFPVDVKVRPLDDQRIVIVVRKVAELRPTQPLEIRKIDELADLQRSYDLT